MAAHGIGLLPVVHGDGKVEARTMTYETILERVPEVTWTPVPGPDHHAVAQRQEYTEDRLRKAAEIVWLWYDAHYSVYEVNAPAGYFENAIPRLRAILQDQGAWNGNPDPDIPFEVYWRALEIMNLPRTEASSSRRVEQPSDVADFDPKAEEDAALAEWVGASAGQG
jgi:hypothetical protein